MLIDASSVVRLFAHLQSMRDNPEPDFRRRPCLDAAVQGPGRLSSGVPRQTFSCQTAKSRCEDVIYIYIYIFNSATDSIL